MLKFDDVKVPEDATGPPERFLLALLNSKPLTEGLHQTEGTRNDRTDYTLGQGVKIAEKRLVLSHPTGKPARHSDFRTAGRLFPARTR